MRRDDDHEAMACCVLGASAGSPRPPYLSALVSIIEAIMKDKARHRFVVTSAMRPPGTLIMRRMPTISLAPPTS